MILKIKNIVTQKTAVQWVGNNLAEVRKFTNNVIVNYIEHTLGIETLEGEMSVSINDYIIKGVNGEFYPCKPDIFDKSYIVIK